MGRYARNSIGQYAPVGAAADDLPGGATPTGKKTIDTTAEVDVASYATAQVVDVNLVAGNIKKDVVILGTTGSYEGGGGGDFTSATVTFVLGNNLKAFQFESTIDYPQYNENTSNQMQYTTCEVFGNTKDSPSTLPDIESTQSSDIILYQGEAYIRNNFTGFFASDEKYSTSFTLAGNAEVVADGDFAGYILVTGDCTITVDWTT